MLKFTESRTGLKSFIESRTGWHRIFDHPIPIHANRPLYTFGGMLLVLGAVQGFTGIILMQYYHPHPGVPGAFDSTLDMTKIPYMNFVRNLHYWGAQIMVIVTLLHVIRTFLSGSYKKPREIQWLTGVGLLVLLFLFMFTGTVLKWDQEAIEALGHQKELASSMGQLGSFFTDDFTHTVPLVARLYAAHVTIIPILALPVVGIHLMLIRILGLSKKKNKNKEIEARDNVKVTYWSHVKVMLLYGTILTAMAALLAIAIQAPLGGARGVEGIEVTKPPWFLLWMVPIEDAFGLGAVPYVIGIALIVLAAIPLIDRKAITGRKMRVALIAAMFISASAFITLLIMGYTAPQMAHLSGSGGGGMAMSIIPQAFAHAGAGAGVIQSDYFSGNLALTTDPGSQQWKQASENNIKSLWGHEITVRSLNNGSKILFLLSWPAGEKSSGAAVMFEEPNDVWVWNTGAVTPEQKASQDEGVITKAQWNNGHWNVVFDRQIQPQNRGNVSFSTGILEKGWIKFTVWDGSKKVESFANINDNMLVHSNFVLLSYNDVQRNDASLWLGLIIVAGGSIVFIFIELSVRKSRKIHAI